MVTKTRRNYITLHRVTPRFKSHDETLLIEVMKKKQKSIAESLNNLHTSAITACTVYIY